MPAASIDALFGETLRQQRLAAGLTQEELAERAELSARAVSDLERGVKRAPRPSTVRLLVAGLGLSVADAAALEAAAREHTAPVTNNLPHAFSSFVGRSRELAELRQSLDAARLVTLTGAGGVGKSRLALELAARVLPDFPNGVWLVELAAVLDAALLPHVACLALGIKTLPGRSPIDALAATLAPRTTLIVLDNCEHLLRPSSELVQHLLRVCPQLKVLATSREPLGLLGETSWAVPALSLAAATEQHVQSEAVQLFVERATAANRALVWEEPALAAATLVCQRVDGVPLALELAAAWTRPLTVAEIADRLAASASLLAAPHAATHRHRTLRATVEWSLALLAEPERDLFARLSVFAGGFTLDAAAAVVDGDVLGPLARLVNASLVLHEGGRYRLLQPIRQVAEQDLGAAADGDATRQRHAQYFLALVDSVQASLWGRTARGGGINVVEADVGNLRAALGWFVERGESESAGQLGAGLARFWLFSERVSEGRAWLARLLELPGLSMRTRARLLVGAGASATYELDLGSARSFLEAGQVAARHAADDWSIAWALFLFAWAAPPRSEELDFDRLLEMCAEGAARSRAAGDPVLELMHDLTGAILRARAGNAAEAEAAARQGLRRVEHAGAPREFARAQMALGIALYARGELSGARQALERSRVAWEAEGEGLEVPTFAVTTGLLIVACDVGDRKLARAHLLSLLDLWSRRGRLPQLAGACLGAFAYLSAAEQQPRRVVAAGASLATGGQSLDVLRFFGRSVAHLLEPARAVLGSGGAAQAWAAGESQSLEDACGAALQVAREAPPPDPARSTRGRARSRATGRRQK